MNTTFTDPNATLLRGQQSDIGKRPNQEDRWEIREFQTADGRPATLALVADGIGGHNTGEIASQMAKAMIPERLLASPPSASEITRRLKVVLAEVGQAIYDASLQDPSRSGMGTTCTAIVVADRRLYLAHVGDSRAYLLRGGKLRQLTIDHTWAEEAIRAGRAPEEIRTHPNRGVIMRYLGIDPTVNIDTRYRDAGGEITDALQAGPLFLEPGDTLMLCSDGVSDSMEAGQVAEFLAYPDCQTAADALVSQALKAGATDNVTTVVLRVPGGVVAPPAALVSAGKKRPVLPLILAALGLVVVGVILVLVFASRAGRQSGAQPSPTAGVAAAATQALSPTAMRPEATGGGVQVATAATVNGAVAATLPAVTATAALPGTVPAPGASPAPGEPTVIPTFTPLPTQAPATVPPRPTSATPRPGAPTSQSSAVSTGGVILLRPAPGERIEGSAEFAWQPDAGSALKAGELYELIVWGVGEDPLRDGRSPVGGATQTVVRADLAGSEGVLSLSSGTSYFWGVRLLGANGKPLRMLAEGRQFVYEKSAGGGGGGDVTATPVPATPVCTGPGCK